MQRARPHNIARRRTRVRCDRRYCQQYRNKQRESPRHHGASVITEQCFFIQGSKELSPRLGGQPTSGMLLPEAEDRSLH